MVCFVLLLLRSSARISMYCLRSEFPAKTLVIISLDVKALVIQGYILHANKCISIAESYFLVVGTYFTESAVHGDVPYHRSWWRMC